MATCSVRWRPSGGRGEFEYVPGDVLEDREISVFVEAFNVSIPSEVTGRRVQGKPRLRKRESNNRNKLHLPQLVMAVARLPEPARQDLTHEATFPLENKAYIMESMDFDIIEDDGIQTSLAPLRMHILHSDYVVDLQDRFDLLAEEWADLEKIEQRSPQLADSIALHRQLVLAEVNSRDIRDAADEVISSQISTFGSTNVGSVLKLIEDEALPEAEIEENLSGVEGRLLVRIHHYRERDRKLVKAAKDYYRSKNGGKLICEGCDMDPFDLYGKEGDRCIEAHHRVPLEQLQPDSITTVQDLIMLCANCHRVVHSSKPCLTLAELRERVAKP